MRYHDLCGVREHVVFGVGMLGKLGFSYKQIFSHLKVSIWEYLRVCFNIMEAYAVHVRYVFWKKYGKPKFILKL